MAFLVSCPRVSCSFARRESVSEESRAQFRIRKEQRKVPTYVCLRVLTGERVCEDLHAPSVARPWYSAKKLRARGSEGASVGTYSCGEVEQLEPSTSEPMKGRVL